MHYYYYFLNSPYNISNFSVSTFSSLPVGKPPSLASRLALPIAGGIAGYVYGDFRHDYKLNELHNRLAQTINPLERAQIKQEIKRISDESFFNRLALVATGFLGGSAIRNSLAAPHVTQINKR